MIYAKAFERGQGGGMFWRIIRWGRGAGIVSRFVGASGFRAGRSGVRGFLAALLVVLVFGAVSQAQTTTYTVDDDWQSGSSPYTEDTDGDTDFATIQKAIDAAMLVTPSMWRWALMLRLSTSARIT